MNNEFHFVNVYQVHDDRYFGRKYTVKDKLAYTNAVKKNDIVLKAFNVLGYNVDRWGPSKMNCIDLDLISNSLPLSSMIV